VVTKIGLEVSNLAWIFEEIIPSFDIESWIEADIRFETSQVLVSYKVQWSNPGQPKAGVFHLASSHSVPS
jgi:hypothetical protein